MREMFTAQVSPAESLTFAKYVKFVGDGPGSTLPPCPEPNGTMFTTMTPTTTTTTTATSHVTSCSSSAVPSTTTKAQTPLPSSSGTGTSANTGRTTQNSASTSTGTTGTNSPGTSATTPSLSTGTAKAIILNQEIPAEQDVVSSTSTSGGAATATTSSGASSTATSSSTPGSTTSGSTTTTFQTTPSAEGSSTVTSNACVVQELTGESKKTRFRMPTVYSTLPEDDPFYNWMSSIYEYMSKEKEICDQPAIKDLNSITEDQLYGFLATLSAVHPGPFCSLCDRFMNEVRERVFMINPMWGVSCAFLAKKIYCEW
ncbi:unnamed protein product [Strongylus vulgaris]|uniref:Uncharacterized protein n=1 Tax=Strongylus vulgaris TaxID=40348 RepID=A0A3P7KMH9_STRVU|nr:unnamed protein product [Strongylus vulgaris]